MTDLRFKNEMANVTGFRDVIKPECASVGMLLGVWSRDFERFCKDCISIRTDGGNRYFELNKVQKATEHEMKTTKLAHQPFVFYRSCGMTTLITAQILHKMMFKPGSVIAYIGQTRFDIEELLKCVKFMYCHMPEWIQELFPLQFSRVGVQMDVIPRSNNQRIIQSTLIVSSVQHAEQSFRGRRFDYVFAEDRSVNINSYLRLREQLKLNKVKYFSFRSLEVIQNIENTTLWKPKLTIMDKLKTCECVLSMFYNTLIQNSG